MKICRQTNPYNNKLIRAYLYNMNIYQIAPNNIYIIKN